MNSKILTIVTCVLGLSSCGMRSSWDSVPDRAGHAYNSQNTENEAAGTGANRVSHKKIILEDVPQGAILADERLYSVLEGERLYQIAERNAVSLYWLIKRNDLSRLPQTGSQLIIPGVGAQ